MFETWHGQHLPEAGVYHVSKNKNVKLERKAAYFILQHRVRLHEQQQQEFDGRGGVLFSSRDESSRLMIFTNSFRVSSMTKLF